MKQGRMLGARSKEIKEKKKRGLLEDPKGANRRFSGEI